MSSGRLSRRDFIHRMSLTLGLTVATAATEPLRFIAPQTPEVMTWSGDTFPRFGEIPALRKLATELLARGLEVEAHDLLVRAAGLLDADDAAYRDALDALGRVCTRTGRERAATSVAWYLESTASPRDPRDGARVCAALGDGTRAADLWDRVGFRAHAALASGARLRLFELAAPSEPTLRRALAIHALGTSDSIVERVENALVGAELADAPFTARLVSTTRRQLRTPTFARFSDMPLSLAVLLDTDHGHDPAEICAPILIAPSALRTRMSPSAARFIRRRALVVRLLALDLEHPARTPQQRAAIRATYALRLGQLGDERFLPALDRLVDDEYEDVRVAALRGAAEIVGRDRFVA
jgi:hypothetical protein